MLPNSKRDLLSNANDPWYSIPGALTWVSAASDGSVWGVNSSHIVYRYHPNGLWELVPGDQPLDQVSVASASVVWGLHDGVIYRYNESEKKWHRFVGELVSISAAADGWTWGINNVGMVFRRPPGGTWERVPTPQSLDQVSVGGADKVWGLKNGVIYRYIDDEKGWKTIHGELTSISVAADGSVWGVNKNGNVFRYRGEQRWDLIAGSLKQISAGSANFVWGLTAQETDNLRLWKEPWAPTMPLSVQSSSTLTQDTMSGGPPPIDFTSGSPVALFANPFEGGRAEALVIKSGSQELCHLKRSSAGWELAPLVQGVKTTAREVVAAVAPDNVVWAFFTDENGHFRWASLVAADGQACWSIDPVPGAQWGRLRVVYSSATPVRAPVVYGVSALDTHLVLLYQWTASGATNPWHGGTATLLGGSRPWQGDFLLYPVAANTAKAASGTLGYHMVAGTGSCPAMEYQMRPGGPIEYLMSFEDCFPKQLLIAGPVDNFFVATLGDPYPSPQLLRTTGGQFGLFKEHVKIAGNVAYPKAVAFLDSKQWIHIYGIDPAGVLSVIHQDGWTSAPDSHGYPAMLPTWAKVDKEGAGGGKEATVVPLALDRDVDSVFIDPFPGDRATLLLRMKSGEIVLSTQDLSTGRWSTESIRLSAASGPVEVSCYRTQATLVDANGAPVPRYKVRAKATSIVGVIVAGEHHLLGPDRSVDLETDRMGRLTFCTPASDLTTPRILLNAPGLADGIVLKPDAPVQAYLAGTGSLPLRDKLTGAVLDQAGVLPPGPVSAANVVDQIQLVFGAVGRQLDALQGAGFVLQNLDPTQPAYRVVSSREELASQTALWRADPRYAGVLDDIRKHFGDVWAGITSGAARVSTIVYDLASHAVTLVLQVGAALVEIGQFVIESFRDAARVTTAIFNAAGAAVSRVVDWLRSAFDFKDIWDTKTAFEVDALGRLPEVVKTTLIPRLPAKACKEFLEAQRKPLLDSLEQLRAKLKGQSFQDLPGWSEPSGRAQLRDTRAKLSSTAKGTVTAGDLDSPQTNWLLDAILPHAASLPRGPGFPALEGVWAAVQSALGDVDLSFLKELEQRLVTLFSPGNTDSLGRIAIDAFIEVLVWALNTVITLVEGLVDVLYKLVEAALEGAGALLGTPVTFQPIVDLVDWIYRQAHPQQGEPPPTLTLGGLFSLILAFPATLGWKLFMCDAKAQLFPGGHLPREGQTSRAGAGELTNGQRCLMVGGIIQTIYALVDVANDVESSLVGSVAAVVMEFLIVALVWPTAEGVFPHVESTETPSQQFARWLNWVPGFTCAVCDLAFLMFTAKTDPQVLRNLEPAGKMVLFLFGKLNLVAGFNEIAVVPTSKAGYAANILSPLSPMFQILRISCLKNPTLLSIKVAINVVSDVGGGMARILVATGK